MLSRPPRRRAGMTMIELLVVIAIIALLAALLVGTLVRVRDRGKELQVRADLDALQIAIGKFRADYHQTPLPGAGGGNRGTFRLCTEYPSPATDSWPEVQYLMRMFPRMSRTDNGLRRVDYSTDPPTIQPNATVAANNTSWIELDPNQCMVFFLTGGSFTDYTGFSTDPAQPFKATGSRKNAFFDLPKSKRMSPGTPPGRPAGWFERFKSDYTWLASNNNNVRWNGDASDGRFEPWMVDPWENPYLYFSSNIGNDYPFYLDYPTSSGVPADWREALRIGPWGGEYSPFLDGGGSLYPDAGGTKGPTPFLETFTTGTTATRKFMNRQSFQIISAGPDGQFGPGSPRVGTNYTVFKPTGSNYTQADPGGDDFSNFRPLKLGTD